MRAQGVPQVCDAHCTVLYLSVPLSALPGTWELRSQPNSAQRDFLMRVAVVCGAHSIAQIAPDARSALRT